LFLSFFKKLTRLPYRFSKTYPSFLTVKEGSTSLLGLLPSGKKRKPLLLVALNRCALRLAGHQSPRQVVVRDGTAFLYLLLAKGNGGEGGVSCF